MTPSLRRWSLWLLVALAPACSKHSGGSSGGGGPNLPPAAVITALTGDQTGIIPLAYALSDPDSDPASIVAEWSPDAGANYFPATRGLLGGEGTTGLSTSPAGTGHVFLWDSAADGVGKPSPAAVLFKITPSDAAAGTPGTATFTVDNRVTCFRATSFILRDPHVFFSFILCIDVTDSGGGIPGVPPGGVNGSIQAALTTDGDGDGFLDASPLLLFRRFDQTGPGGYVELASGRFAAATPTTGDLQPGTPRAPTTFANVTASPILAPLPGTTKPYAPAVSTPSGTGFVTVPVTYTITVGAISIPLEGFRVAGIYPANPATSITNGLAMGFLSESAAQSTPVDLGAFGTVPLASLLAGGAGSCTAPADDDRDTGPDGVTSGWWFYFNFTAQAVTYTGP